MARQLTSLVLLFVPIVILNTLRFIVTPLGEMMKVSIELDIILHILCLSLGIILFRKTRIVRDHEWQRAQAVKSVSGHFRAEEKGVWESNVSIDPTLSPEAEENLRGNVGVATVGLVPSVQEIDTEVEVEMLVDTEHVRRAQARVSGDEQFESDSVKATIGAVRKSSPMDRFLDWISELFGRDTKSERDAKKSELLISRSQVDPVVAQRPIAPIEPIETDRKRPQPMEMISITDQGDESIVIDEESSVIVETTTPKEQSIEEMAYGVSKDVPMLKSPDTTFSADPKCKVCGTNNPVGERYCSNCGSDL